VRDGGATRKVTAEELLGRTVFYKVGHHASHNATASAKGLELMGDAGLTAFIPVDGEVAARKGWTMPAPSLYASLRDKARGRVFRSDDAVAPGDLYVDFFLPELGAPAASVAPPRGRPEPARRAGTGAGVGAGINVADPDRLPRRRTGGKTREPRRPHRK
jgi:hypothetical protein